MGIQTDMAFEGSYREIATLLNCRVPCLTATISRTPTMTARDGAGPETGEAVPTTTIFDTVWEGSSSGKLGLRPRFRKVRQPATIGFKEPTSSRSCTSLNSWAANQWCMGPGAPED